MAISPAVLWGGTALTTSAVAQYTAPTGTKAVVKRAVFANTTGGAVTLTVTVTRSGGSPVTLINARSVASNAADLAPELANFVLNPGDAINAQASAGASINSFGSGFTSA